MKDFSKLGRRVSVRFVGRSRSEESASRRDLRISLSWPGSKTSIPAFFICRMRYPGEVWFLPADAREGGDTKGRRHVLLTECRDTDDLATLAYASTRNGEAARGAAFVKIDPQRTPFGQAGHSGFDRPTYVYPCRLVGSEADNLVRMTGRLVDEMPEIRSKLTQALGIGTGSCDRGGRAANSWRGRVITLVDSLAEEIGTPYGLIITEPRYSTIARYQIFAPLLNAAEFDAEELDIRIADSALRRLGNGWDAALIATREVQSAFHRKEIKASTGIVVSGHVMAQVDEALRELFGL